MIDIEIKEQITNVFTNALNKQQHYYLVQKLGVGDLFQQREQR